MPCSQPRAESGMPYEPQVGFNPFSNFCSFLAALIRLANTLLPFPASHTSHFYTLYLVFLFPVLP